MGSTVSTEKRAYAFQAADKTVYALFEKKYEKNCYPHTPRWNCHTLGTLESVIQRIFSYAGDCEGGMLQGPKGWILPENYIKGWLAALSAPYRLHDKEVSLSLCKLLTSEDEYTAATRAKAIRALTESGRVELIDHFRSGNAFHCSLYDEVEVILGLCGKDWIVAPWSLLDQTDTSEEPAPELGYLSPSGECDQPGQVLFAKPTGFPCGGYYAVWPDGNALKVDNKGKILDGRDGDGVLPRRFLTAQAADAFSRKAQAQTIVLPEFCKLDGDKRLIKDARGVWRYAGWSYRFMSDFIFGLSDLELRLPGAYRGHIKAMRDALQNAPQVPNQAKVIIDLTQPIEDWALTRVQDLAKATGAIQTQSQMEITVDITDTRMVHDLTCVPAEAAVWLFSQEASSQPETPVQDHGGEQLELCAA